MTQTKLLKNATIMAVNLIILFFAARWMIENIHLVELGRAFNRISLLSLVAVAMINMIVVVLFAYRLATLIEQPFSVAFSVACLGAGLNGILPFRLGDVTRIYYSKRFYRISATQLIAVSFAEKLFDLTALGLMVSLLLVIGGGNLIGGGLVATLTSMLIVGVVGLFFLFRHAEGVASRFCASEFLRTAIISLKHHLRIRRKATVSLATGGMWLTNLMVVYVGLIWFLPLTDISLMDATAVLLIVALAIAVPGAPAGLGIFEAGVVSYLTLVVHLGSETALAAAFLLHMAISLPTIILALAIILKPRRMLVV
ncbi:MAG: flippase-like domain-containing protein [Rhodocyclaceae bacterium]|nr:MAG: flippase-like domain-containing protein [Rhodocyclaceae bacterium]